MEKIKLSIKPRAPVSMTLSVGGSGGGFDYYEGDYEVTPRISEQSLATAKKIMRDDVTIHGIPHWETQNPHGKTYVIGEN